MLVKVEVEKCEECPFFGVWDLYCHKSDKTIYDSEIIQSWCELKDEEL